MIKAGDFKIPVSDKKMTFEEDIDFIEQIVKVLDESGNKLEEVYSQKDIEGSKELKNFMRNINQKILEVLE